MSALTALWDHIQYVFQLGCAGKPRRDPPSLTDIMPGDQVICFPSASAYERFSRNEFVIMVIVSQLMLHFRPYLSTYTPSVKLGLMLNVAFPQFIISSDGETMCMLHWALANAEDENKGSSLMLVIRVREGEGERFACAIHVVDRRVEFNVASKEFNNIKESFVELFLHVRDCAYEAGLRTRDSDAGPPIGALS
jgi:hypothetical protein